MFPLKRIRAVGVEDAESLVTSRRKPLRASGVLLTTSYFWMHFPVASYNGIYGERQHL